MFNKLSAINGFFLFLFLFLIAGWAAKLPHNALCLLGSSPAQQGLKWSCLKQTELNSHQGFGKHSFAQDVEPTAGDRTVRKSFVAQCSISMKDLGSKTYHSTSLNETCVFLINWQTLPMCYSKQNKNYWKILFDLLPGQ